MLYKLLLSTGEQIALKTPLLHLWPNQGVYLPLPKTPEVRRARALDTQTHQFKRSSLNRELGKVACVLFSEAAKFEGTPLPLT